MDDGIPGNEVPIGVRRRDLVDLDTAHIPRPHHTEIDGSSLMYGKCVTCSLKTKMKAAASLGIL